MEDIKDGMFRGVQEHIQMRLHSLLLDTKVKVLKCLTDIFKKMSEEYGILAAAKCVPAPLLTHDPFEGLRTYLLDLLADFEFQAKKLIKKEAKNDAGRSVDDQQKQKSEEADCEIVSHFDKVDVKTEAPDYEVYSVESDDSIEMEDTDSIGCMSDSIGYMSDSIGYMSDT